jgi:hypothetical protein
LTTLCSGRNDLSQFFDSNSSQESKSFDNSKKAPTSQEHSTNNDSILSIDWNDLASNLLLYNASNMCTQSFTTGSGNIKQAVLVNRTCRCVLFDQVFNSSVNLQTLIGPLLYGKIYYHPSNIHYDNLIKQMNQTFESLDELITLFRQIQSIIQPSYQILLSSCNLLSNSSDICQQLYSYQTPLSLFTILTEFLACSERNRFVAKSSELDMVQDGQNNSVINTFLAAIEFLDEISDNDSLPKHIRYKIRMTLDYVDDTFRTEDR